MTQIFTAQEYDLLHSLAFAPYNPGYRPEVKEAPNGDGKVDVAKRYAHIAKKYITDWPLARQAEKQLVEKALHHAHGVALGIAIDLGIPQMYWPNIEDGTLRVLEYDHTAGAEVHTDPDLFTLMCYRNLPEFFVTVYDGTYQQVVPLDRARKINTQFHFGQMAEMISPDFKATQHRVMPTNKAGVHQYSIVYFAIPPLAAVLPNGVTVKAYLDEWKTRGRYDVKP